MNEPIGPEEVRRTLIQRSVEDDTLRQRLLTEPQATVEEEMGAMLPEEIGIRAVEETPETTEALLSPGASSTVSGDGELTNRNSGRWSAGGAWAPTAKLAIACDEESCKGS